MSFVQKAAIYIVFAVGLFHILRFGMDQQFGTMMLPRSSENKHATIGQNSNYIHHAIIIPYRERLDNARSFVSYMGAYLTRNFPNETFSVYFVAQVDSGLFSRAFLLNAGLNEIKRTRPETKCVIMHDVDLLPIVDGVPYDNCTYPMQLSSEMEQFNWGVPYAAYCGGVINLHMNDWLKINGMSNDFEGWGGEDDDLFIRLQRTGLLLGPENKEVLRPPKGKGKFSNQENASTISNRKRRKYKHAKYPKYKHAKYSSNLAILGEMASGSNRWRTDGLNDVAYKLIDHVELLPKGTSVGNRFDVHIVKVTGRENCLGPNINVTIPCIKGFSF